MLDTLTEFLRSGDLCGLHLGMNRQDVLNTLGEPEDVGIGFDIWLYGAGHAPNLQLSFAAERIHGIWLYFLGRSGPGCLPDLLHATDWPITGTTTIDEFTQILDRSDVSWTNDERLTFDTQTCVLVQSGAECVWSHEPELELEKILLTAAPMGKN